jgi:hypothetical protein
MLMRIPVAALILAFVASSASAEPTEWPKWPLRSKDNASKGTWSLIDENDLFGGTDRNYTNGLQFSWLSAKNDLPPAIDWMTDRLSFLAKPGADWRYGFVAGQTMYTPTDITIAAPQPGDRPYSGWLFGGLSLTADSGDRLDTIEFHAGVVGPASGAEFVQRNWHAQIGSPDPKGWDNQLHNEPGAMLVYERKWRNLAEFGVMGLGADVTPHAGFALGNIHTHAAAGATVRIGKDLADDFGPPRIRPALAGAGYFEPSNDFSWYLFGGVEGRAVARNIFLDGNTFQDSLSVDKEPFVGDVQAGIVLQALGTQLAFTGVYRTEEFKGQDKPDLFGAISLGWKW